MLHDLRSAWITWQAEAGTNPKAVAQIAGHADELVTLRIYQDVTGRWYKPPPLPYGASYNRHRFRNQGFHPATRTAGIGGPFHLVAGNAAPASLRKLAYLKFVQLPAAHRTIPFPMPFVLHSRRGE